MTGEGSNLNPTPQTEITVIATSDQVDHITMAISPPIVPSGILKRGVLAH